MRRDLVLLMLVPLMSSGSQNCEAPPDAIAKLKAYLSYESSAGSGRSGEGTFSVAASGSDTLFLQHRVPPGHEPDRRVVYVFRPGSPIFATECPVNARWTECAEHDFRVAMHEVNAEARHSFGPTCELQVAVPEWHPTPDGNRKRILGAEVLQELFRFGYVNPKEVLVRNFNVSDPELDFYIVGEQGNVTLQGCFFDADREPHCVWHLYGQSSAETLKHRILADPFNLYPQQSPVPHPRK